MNMEYIIFVTAVEPNTIASKAGIISGDFLLDLNENEVGVDGLMTSYCNQLKTGIFRHPFRSVFIVQELTIFKIIRFTCRKLNIPPIIELEVCPTSLRIGETYDFNILFVEGTSEATSISVILALLLSSRN